MSSLKFGAAWAALLLSGGSGRAQSPLDPVPPTAEPADSTLAPAQAVRTADTSAEAAMPSPADAGTAIVGASTPPETLPDTVKTDSVPKPEEPRPPDTASTRGLRNLGTTVVHGKARGRALARQERREADVRKDVVSIESIQEHPDPDVAEALQRVPGVTLQRGQGEGHYVQIRGTEPRLSSVTVNGQKLASSSGDTRAVALDVVPVDQLSEIEVAKVLMPEMDGEAIGGAVNLVTPGARDTQLVLKALLAGGGNDLSGRPVWQGSAAVSRRFLEGGALGVYLGGSWFRNRTRTDALNLDWDTIPQYRDVVWNLDEREYLKTKERTGASARLDLRLGDGAMVFATGNWSRMDDAQLRNRFSVHREGATQLSPDSFKFDDALKYSREARWQERIQTVSQATLGGGAGIGPVRTDLSVTGSSSATRQDPNLRATFAPIHKLTSYIDPSDPDAPYFDAFYYPRPAGIDPRAVQASEYRLSKVRSVARRADEDDLHGRLDARWPVGADSVWLLGAGVKAGWNAKSQSVWGGSQTVVEGTAPLGLEQVLSSDSVTDFHRDRYSMGPLPDIEAVRAWLGSNGGILDTTASSDDHIQNDPECYRIVQGHWAGYVQAKWKEGDLSAVGGLRAERFDLHLRGNLVIPQADQTWSSTQAVVADRSYDFLLPMVSGRWTFAPAWVARASYGRSFALPDVLDLLPTSQTDLLELTVKRGNPDLRPTLSDALEIDLEWYRRPRGLASIGLFGKRLVDYVFPVVWGEWDNLRKAPFTNFAKANGEVAWLGGIELEAQQPLDFLPSILSGLGVEANWTWTASATTLPGRSSESSLPGQSEHSGNAGLRFDRSGFSALLAWNAQGPFLYQIGSRTENDTWVDWHARLDASASQRLGRGVLVYLHLSNLTDAPYRLYQNGTRHPVQIEHSGRTAEGGVRLSL